MRSQGQPTPPSVYEQKKAVHIELSPQHNLPPINKQKLSVAVGWAKKSLEGFWMLLKRKKQSNLGHHSKKVTIKERIHPRYLELEPLCCLSSCLVRTGCCAAVTFNLFFVAITAFVIGLKIYDGGRIDVWDELDTNFNAIITHQTSLYLLGLFDLLTLFMSMCLLYGIFSFERAFLKIHWRFDFFALGFNVVAFFLFVFALNSEGPETWTWKNVLLAVAFASQIPLQLWAISVVKACYDFYVLLYVFVTLSEK